LPHDDLPWESYLPMAHFGTQVFGLGVRFVLGRTSLLLGSPAQYQAQQHIKSSFSTTAAAC
jgi:hypothetical protein